MKLYSIYFTNIMGEEAHEVVASDHSLSEDEAREYLRHHVYGGHIGHSDVLGIETVVETHIEDINGNKIENKLGEAN